MLTILLILLGCNIPYLLNSRIYEAVKFVEKLNETNVNWFLSGGIKNLQEGAVSEAHKMAYHLSNSQYINTNNWNYIIDSISTNTAENFIMARKYIREANMDYSDVYIATSKFHYKRANLIADKIFTKNINLNNHIGLKWILADDELEDSVYWEKIHIKNVDADVNKANAKFTIF